MHSVARPSDTPLFGTFSGLFPILLISMRRVRLDINHSTSASFDSSCSNMRLGINHILLKCLSHSPRLAGCDNAHSSNSGTPGNSKDLPDDCASAPSCSAASQWPCRRTDRYLRDSAESVQFDWTESRDEEARLRPLECTEKTKKLNK